MNGVTAAVELHFEDDPAALSRIVRIASTNLFRLESLTMVPSEEPGCRRATIVVDTGVTGVDLLVSRLDRLVSVRRVRAL